MKPDPTVEPGELFRQFCRKRPSEIRLVRRDTTDFPIKFRVLTHNENEIAKMRALEHFKKKNIDIKDDVSLYCDRVACEVLWIACREPDSVFLEGKEIEDPFFKSTNALSEELSSDELAQFFEIYKQVQYKLGPWEKDIEPKDLDEWINRLGTGAMESGFLIRWDSPQLVSLVIMMAERLHSTLTQLPDSPYSLKYLSSNSDSGTTSLTEGQSEQPTKVVFNETSKGLSEVFAKEKEGQNFPPRSAIKTPEEAIALAKRIRNNGK